jgi:hydroxymethylglutaryl-CoA lyase
MPPDMSNPQPRFPERAIIREVGLRDGLQSIATIMPTANKVEWIQGAYDAGQREIEVGSFVPARLLPQLADTADLVRFGKTLPKLVVSVLVPNLKGAETAIETGADVLLVPLSASHAHSLANLRKTPDEVVAEVGRIRASRDAAGSRCLIEGGVGTAFGCTLQGRVEPSEVLRLVQALLDAGADRVSLADTVGYADPRMVRELFEQALRIAGDRFCCGHFHDTRGLAMANVYAARARREPVRRDARRHRRLPARAGRERQRLERGPGLYAGQHAHRDRHRRAEAPRAAYEGRRMARRRIPARHAVARRLAQDLRNDPVNCCLRDP